MCRYNMSFNDAVMNELRPHFKDEESLLVWLEVNMDHLMREYIARFKRPKLNGILGKQGASFSWENLREDAYSDKYGI